MIRGCSAAAEIPAAVRTVDVERVFAGAERPTVFTAREEIQGFVEREPSLLPRYRLGPVVGWSALGL